MMRCAVTIELQEDCVFSARAATEGGHESLDRIPGATLLGAAASRLYPKLDRRQAFTAFHSGKVRFSDGLPSGGRSIGYPIPLSWHHDKARQPTSQDQLVPDRIFNFQHVHGIEAEAGGEVQPKQMRTGYVHLDGRLSKPAHALRLKTAIEPTTGRAAEGQLFGYDALARGQCFVAVIEADDDLERTLFERVVETLSGEVLLGRSRSAEYGRARVAITDIEPPTPGPVNGNRLTLWLLADLALQDRYGQPALRPDTETLGLTGAKVVWDKTFLRSRRYSPWNAARHGYDRERLVLTAGGVITLELPEPPSREQVDRLHTGIGLHREAGLGRVWVNPPLLSATHPPFAPESGDAPSAGAPAKPQHPLIIWLENQSGTRKSEAEAEADKIAEEYRQRVTAARRNAGVGSEVAFGPSRSQWSRVFDAARHRSGQDLYDALFEGDSAIIKVSGEGWNVETLANGRWQKLGEWLREQLEFTGDASAYAHLVRQLSHRVRDDIDKRRI